jgi:hypothetical protein
VQDVVLTDLDKAKEEIVSLKSEAEAQRKELHAVSHHRGILRDTIEQQEKFIRSKIDSVVSAAISNLSSSRNMFPERMSAAEQQNPASPSSRQRHPLPRDLENDEHNRRQIARYRARALAMEELVVIYRSGILALYADGKSYGAAQYSTEVSAAGVSGSGWIEHEISTIKRSFEEEIRVLDSDNVELRGKLQQSSSYISELRKRFEENIKVLYR